ncbi:hypothetical protein [Helicobacter mustelae]|uniref:hypothetical protein n=1 Tax=Helicobacter mustelae TaxID=217 RepID=UPI0002EAA020|nr:hypothetical protein [Helicobacter mustelae]SQH70816.1 Uncharacterised protein [Helicobacter mustelae]STP11942.1 Uncharacterised protein [Helicobacter mustelae]
MKKILFGLAILSLSIMRAEEMTVCEVQDKGEGVFYSFINCSNGLGYMNFLQASMAGWKLLEMRDNGNKNYTLILIRER